MVECPYCGSTKVHINRKPTNQYLCNDCGKYFTLRKTLSVEVAASVKCCNCGKSLSFSGKNRYVDCQDCGFKNFINNNNEAVDPCSLDQGVGTLDIDLTTDEKARIVPVGDIHVGAPKGQCDFEKVKRELEYIEDTPDTYLLGMGDMMDCAQKMPWSRGPNIFSSSLQPMEQFNLMEQVLKPLAKKRKIIGLLTGNHEEWIMMNTGYQIINLLCKTLDVPYLGSACDINVKVGKQQYVLYALHGSGNAQLKHTKLGRLMNCSKDIFADALIMGHVHQLAVAKGGKYQNGFTNKAYYILTGHFLNWVGSYAQAFGLDVCPSGCPKITLFSDRKDIHVSI